MSSGCRRSARASTGGTSSPPPRRTWRPGPRSRRSGRPSIQRRSSRRRSPSRVVEPGCLRSSVVYVDTFGNMKLARPAAGSGGGHRSSSTWRPAGARPCRRWRRSGSRARRHVARHVWGGGARGACSCTRTRTGGSASRRTRATPRPHLGIAEDRDGRRSVGHDLRRRSLGFFGYTPPAHRVDERRYPACAARSRHRSSCSPALAVAGCTTAGASPSASTAASAAAPSASRSPRRPRSPSAGRLREGQPDHDGGRQADDRHRQPGLPAVLPDPGRHARPRRGSSATRPTARASRARSPTPSPTSSGFAEADVDVGRRPVRQRVRARAPRRSTSTSTRSRSRRSGPRPSTCPTATTRSTSRSSR